MHFATLLLGARLAQLGLAAYSLKDDYSGNNFAGMFSFDTEDDPTHGYVNYVDQNTAQSQGLYSVNNGVVTLGVDHTNVASGRGRNSVRVTSHAQYTHGLVVLDLAHMPGSICGTWPAFWMTGPNWPNSGEIDIIEGVNSQSQNKMSLHTSNGCSVPQGNCQGNQGCSIDNGGSSSYGNGFNSANGGTYAMEWTSSQISVWFFSRGSEPSDINSANPNPTNWGSPTASFASGSSCDIDSHFMNNNIVFDTTFCGDWAGQVFSSDSTCSALASSCTDYVQNNPSAFADAYWAINYLKVYEQGGASTQVAIATSPSAHSVASIAQTAPSAPIPTYHSSSAAQPPASGSVSSLIGRSTTSESPGVPSPTPASPPETGSVATHTVVGTGIVTQTLQSSASPEAGSVTTEYTTGNGVVTQTAEPWTGRGSHHGNQRPPIPWQGGPQVRRSRVARHIREHAGGRHS